MADREPPCTANVARVGPSVLDCLEAAMRADPSLTIGEAIRTVPVSQETINRYARNPETGTYDAEWPG